MSIQVTIFLSGTDVINAMGAAEIDWENLSEVRPP